MARGFALSPHDNRYAAKLRPLETLFSEKAFVAFRVRTEVAWLQKLAREGIIKEAKLGCPAEDLPYRLARFNEFSEEDFRRFKDIEATTNHDVKAVEYFVKGVLAELGFGPEFREFTHFLCTSEDINNVAYALMLSEFRDALFLPALASLVLTLNDLAQEHRGRAMMSLTHGQPATPTTLGKELANFAFRVQRQRDTLKTMTFMAKMNGATGCFNGHCAVHPDIDWVRLVGTFIEEDLGLTFNLFTTQIEPHDSLVEFLGRLGHTNTICVGLSQDLWGYVSRGYFRLRVRPGEVGSSIMPHKVNPIDFENAEGNFGVANGLIEHFCRKLPISRFQRDLSDSTVLRNLGVAAGHSLLALDSLERGLGKITCDPDALDRDLDGHYELLAEPIQMILRAEGVEGAYELLKDFTRGHSVTKQSLDAFVEGLPVTPLVKRRLLDLNPRTYIGRAEDIVRSLDETLGDDEEIQALAVRRRERGKAGPNT